MLLVSNVASSPLLLLTAPPCPGTRCPGWMCAAGEPLSLTHAAEAARRLAVGGGLDGRLLGAELLVAAGYAVAAVALLVPFERGSRRRHARCDVTKSAAGRTGEKERKKEEGRGGRGRGVPAILVKPFRPVRVVHREFALLTPGGASLGRGG
ncbi:hypothetical protein ACFYU9_21235 [Streptomyces sp. NPDC004327]|uniref:hypothetical protein n=1 Tax=Streptomyces sp. NPDC004327 TaxID=3364699 RepID=UPI0036AD01BD